MNNSSKIFSTLNSFMDTRQHLEPFSHGKSIHLMCHLTHLQEVIRKLDLAGALRGKIKFHTCLNIQSPSLLKNPSQCSKFFRTKKSMDIQNSPNVNADLGKQMGPFFSEPFSLGRLRKPLVFTICTGTCSYIGCAIWNYENYKSRSNAFINDIRGGFRAHNENYKPSVTSEPEWRKELRRLWNNLHPGERLFVPILFANALVFAAWSVPRLHMFMYKYFASNPQSKTLCSPMLSSVFSHQAPLHLLANMFVLHSFMPNAVQDLGKEQFLGFYLTAGVTSSLVSYIHKMLSCKPGFSIGASGAIMAVLGYTCISHPNTELGILFVPYLRFSAENAIIGIVLLDVLGVLFRWKLFDHAAHLGGALFGILYAKYGEALWSRRSVVVKYWKQLRSDS